MKRYLVFAAGWKDKGIGWDHFRLATDDLEEAKRLNGDYDWVHIVDSTSLTLIHSYGDLGWDGEDAKYPEWD